MHRAGIAGPGHYNGDAGVWQCALARRGWTAQLPAQNNPIDITEPDCHARALCDPAPLRFVAWMAMKPAAAHAHAAVMPAPQYSAIIQCKPGRRPRAQGPSALRAAPDGA